MNTCPFYRFYFTTYEEKPPPRGGFFRPTLVKREWCEHPDSTFKKHEFFGLLPCEGAEKKCPFRQGS